jgi:hypothetical protein
MVYMSDVCAFDPLEETLDETPDDPIEETLDAVLDGVHGAVRRGVTCGN